MGNRTKKKHSETRQSPGRTRAILYGVLLALGASALVVWAYVSRSPSIPKGAFRGYNLLFVTIDTVRADRLGSYGSPAGFTPHLDRLAAEGIRFANVLAHAPLTLPAHTSIFSARNPTKHGVHDNGTFRVDTSLPTLATVLKEAGYRTGAFVGAFVLDARFGLNQGFDVYDDYYGEKRSFLSFEQLERRADAVIAPAERWILDGAEEPWFAWVHLFDAHAPYEAPAKFRNRFPSDPYGAEVAYVDEMVGKFLESLTSAGAIGETLVVVLGDHGESLGEHGERTHGTFAYGSTLRVPWLVWAATGLKPQVFRGPVRQVDVMPTILDMLGIDPPLAIDGQTLRPFLSGESPFDTPVAYFEALSPHLTQDWAPLRGVVEDGYKLVRLPIPELYDLGRDPDEIDNLYQREPALARRLEASLDAMLAGTETAAPRAPDLETARRLQALGYLSTPVENRRSDYSVADDPKRLIGWSNAYEEAKDFFIQGKAFTAIAMFEDLVEQQPRSSQAYQALAYALHQLGRVDEAVDTLEKGVESGVSDLSLLYLLSAYLLDSNDVPKATALLEDLVRREPDYAEAHNYLGVAYGRMGRHEDARREFEEVLALDPSSASAYNNLGSLFLARGDTEKATRFFRQALVYDSELASAHNGLGVAYARSGDVSAAIDAWRRTIELNPSHFDALYNLAMALAEQAPREAVPYLKRYAAEAPPERYGADIERVRLRLIEIERSSSQPSG